MRSSGILMHITFLPSIAENNRQWRTLKDDINSDLAHRLAELTELYKRD